MGKIIRLDEVTINQIAAGEVVERPSSVVKELVENAIDAGAKRIEIYLTNGGRQKIQVVDDGAGMEREDAILAIERHTTSKIREFTDLLNSNTLGFRGEALASIAAVSRLTLQTAVDPGVPGTKIRVEGGVLQTVEPVGAPRGTNICVENLFFNTPARLKFMRSIPSEVANVKEIVTSLALGYPEISFRLLHHEMKLVHTLGTGDSKQTLEQIFSPAICQELFPVAGAYGPLRITGFLGRPNIARGNRGQQYFYLNRRFFRSRLVAAAAERAYDTLLPVARFPFLLLNLELPPELVDVNVHPTKMEVKFRDEKEVFRGIVHIIREALAAHVVTSPWRTPYKPPAVPGKGEEAATGLETATTTSAPGQVKEASLPFAPGPPPAPAPTAGEGVAEPAAAQEVDGARVFTLFDTYLLWEEADALVLVDQHAAHERILYDRLRSGPAAMMQHFLAPLTIELTPTQLQTIQEEGERLRGLGWEFEAFGGEAIILRSGPQGFSAAEVEDLFLSLLNELGATGEARQVDPQERLLRLMACRQAVKAGDRLAPQEAVALIRDLRRTKVPQTCPHGRPTMVAINRTELEKMFQRR